MSVVWIAFPVTLLIAAGFVVAFIVMTRQGQYEDTETPALRMLIDDEPAPQRTPAPPTPRPTRGDQS